MAIKGGEGREQRRDWEAGYKLVSVKSTFQSDLIPMSNITIDTVFRDLLSHFSHPVFVASTSEV